MIGAANKPAGVDRCVGRQSIAQASEAFLKRHDVSPTARLLGIELISRFNPRTMECFPSEQYLARAIGVGDRSIRKAKSELRDKGLIDWQRGHRGQCCNYVISWRRLKVSLEQFRADTQAEFGGESGNLIALHNQVQGEIGGTTGPVLDDRGGTTGPVLDEKAALQGRITGTAGPEYRHHRAALLSHENTLECARGREGSQEQAELEPHLPSNLISCNGSGKSKSELFDQHSRTTTSMGCAEQLLLERLAPRIRDKLSVELYQGGIKVCRDSGPEEAIKYILDQRRKAKFEQ